jgi:hypothetical protein
MLGVIFGNQFDIDQRYQGKRAESGCRAALNSWNCLQDDELL